MKVNLIRATSLMLIGCYTMKKNTSLRGTKRSRTVQGGHAQSTTVLCDCFVPRNDIFYITFIIVLLCSATLSYAQQLNDPSDPKATKETKALFYSMQRLVDAGVMFGHHDDTGYGVNWKYQQDSSDVKGITGS